MTTLESGPRIGSPRPVRGIASRRVGTFDALGHRFDVECGDAHTAALVGEAFADLAVSALPITTYRIESEPDVLDDLAVLVAKVHHHAIAAAEPELVLRAGCVEFGGGTLLVSGAVGSGISTLVAALTLLGGTYLGDGALVVEQRSGRVVPFPQPLVLDDRSLDLVPGIEVIGDDRALRSRRRLVALGCKSRPVDRVLRKVAAVVFLRLGHRDTVTVRPVSLDDAVVRLAEQMFNFPGHEMEAIDALHRLAAGAAAFQLSGGDPRASARAVVEELAAGPSTDPGSSQSGHRMCPSPGITRE